MANWAADFLTRNPDLAALPVEKLSRHSIHFKRPGGIIEAYFTGSPCFFLNPDGLWKPLDTTLLSAAGGFYGAPGLDTLIHPDGRVRVNGYQQFIELPGNPAGVLDGDRIVRSFAGGEQYLYLTETGFREEIIIDKKTFPFDKFLVHKTGTLPSRFTEGQTVAVDKNGASFILTGDLAAFAAWLDDAIYPVTIDPDFAESTADGEVRGENEAYATARSTSAYFDITPNIFKVGQFYDGDSYTYNVYRGFLKWDTSAIGAGSVVLQVNQKLVSTSDVSFTDFDVVIKKQDWSAQEPIGAGTREAAYDGCLAAANDDNIWRNTSGMATNIQYTSGNLLTTWVNKTGNTYYSLISSRDIAATTPTGNEYILIATQDHATVEYRPLLAVVYTTGPSFPVLMAQYRQRWN